MAARFWVGGSGTWDDTSTTNWSATSGGAGGASAPTTADTATFDANSGTAATVSVDGTATSSTVTVNKADINLSLTGSPTFTGTLTLTTGTITLNTYTLICATFASSNANARTIAFGTGAITVNTTAGGVVFTTATQTNLTVTGTPVVNVSCNTATATTINPGASPEASAVSFNITTGTYALTTTASNAFNNINFTGFSGSLTGTARTIYGSLTISSGMTVTSSSTTTTFAGTSGTKTHTFNGKTLNFPVVFDAAGATHRFADAFAFGATRTLTLTNGVLNGNGQSGSLGSFALGSGTKTLTLGGGTWSVAGNWDANTNVTNLTVSASTGIISMTSASAKTFAGGGKSWPTLNQGGAGALTVQQSNTFANITDTVQPATITLTAGTTQTVGAFNVAGTTGNLITLNSSSAGSTATLSGGNVINSVSFVSIKDIIATGGTVWSAPTANGNVDAGNNTGWNFNDLLFRYIYNRRKNKVIYPI
jgi:hypothetical protein